ncbi:MAG: PAS domain-containing sensor histidine kinase [Dehalococcoidia bacterium]
MTIDEAPVQEFAAAIAEIDSPLLLVRSNGHVIASNGAFELAYGTPPEVVDTLEACVLDADAADQPVTLGAIVREAGARSGIAMVRALSGLTLRTGYSVTPIGALPDCSIVALEPLGRGIVRTDAGFVEVATAAPTVVWVAASDGSIVLTNQRWTTDLASAQSPAGSVPGPALHPEDYERCRDAWETAQRLGGMYEARARHRTAGGEYREFLTRAVALRDEEDELLGWFGTTTALDSSPLEDDGAPPERVMAAPAEPESTAEYLLSIASHELRGPLAVMQGTVQLAQRRASTRSMTADEVSETLEQVAQQCDRALHLVEELLEHSRLETGRAPLRRTACDLTVLVRNVATASVAADGSHEIDVTAPASCIAEVDGPRIEQVIFNLMDNARKFSPAGSRIDVAVTLVDDDRSVEIAVRDRGRGVPRAERALIFERFHQVSSDDADRGLGIGLAVSKEIVEAHGGTLTAAAPRGRGARFVVRLPVHAPEPPDEADEAHEADVEEVDSDAAGSAEG